MVIISEENNNTIKLSFSRRLFRKIRKISKRQNKPVNVVIKEGIVKGLNERGIEITEEDFEVLDF